MATTTSLLKFSATLIFLLLILLSSTSNAVPISRSVNLMDEGSLGHVKDLRDVHSENVKESWEVMESVVTERMSLEVNDYPGSGANNRHTPRP